MDLLIVKNKIFFYIISFINDNPFIKACLIIGIGALIFLLGVKVGHALNNLML